MRFFSDEIPGSRMIRWYFCHDGALTLDTPTVFNSQNWDSTRGQKGVLGEVRGAARPWVDGSAPPWGPLPLTCDLNVGDLPDEIFAQVVNAGSSDMVPPLFTDGDVFSMERLPPPYVGRAWKMTTTFHAPPDGIDMTFYFGCGFPIEWPVGNYPGWSFSLIEGVQVYRETLTDMFKGEKYFGTAEQWMDGVPHSTGGFVEVQENGTCAACGTTSWVTNSADWVQVFSFGRFHQEVSFRITGTNHVNPDTGFLFTFWFVPNGFMPPRFW